MPIYEYVCEDCNEKYDKFVRSGLAKIEPTCPRCGSTHARKAFSVFGTRGSGSQSATSSAPACGPVG